MNDIIGPQKGRKAVRFDTRVPMKYVLKSALIQRQEAKNATVINMSDTGIMFESKEQLQPGTEIQVEVLLGKTAKMHATGEVIRSFENKETSCYVTALTFTEISDAAMEEINMWYYSQKLMPNPSAAYVQETRKRNTNRYRVGKSFAEYRKKKLVSVGQWKQAEIKRVGQQELILLTRELPQQGETWEILIHMASCPKPIKAAGKVLSVKGDDQNSVVLFKITQIREEGMKILSESTYIKETVDKTEAEASKGAAEE